MATDVAHRGFAKALKNGINQAATAPVMRTPEAATAVAEVCPAAASLTLSLQFRIWGKLNQTEAQLQEEVQAMQAQASPVAHPKADSEAAPAEAEADEEPTKKRAGMCLERESFMCVSQALPVRGRGRRNKRCQRMSISRQVLTQVLALTAAQPVELKVCGLPSTVVNPGDLPADVLTLAQVPTMRSSLTSCLMKNDPSLQLLTGHHHRDG